MKKAKFNEFPELDTIIEEELRINMKEDDWFDVIVNSELLIHIKRNDVGYSVDLYKHHEQDEMDDNHDYDSDFISGCTAFDDDLDKDNEDE